MKKFGKIVAVVAAAASVTAVAASLSACSDGAAEIENTYLAGTSEGNAYGGNDYIEYCLNLMDDGTYEMIKTVYTYGYSMNLGNYCYQIFGTYTEGTSSDGYTPYTLSEATRVIVNAYSLAGGFDIHVDSETAAYPVELPAEVQGEKNMANSADDVIDAYGAEMIVYIAASGNTLSLTNPNA